MGEAELEQLIKLWKSLWIYSELEDFARDRHDFWMMEYNRFKKINGKIIIF